jgi:hypothetical protein
MSTTGEGGRMNHRLSDRVLDLIQTLERLVASAKGQVALGPEYWDPLAAFIAVGEFERIASDYSSFVRDDSPSSTDFDASPFALEVMRWPEYIEVMSQWALSPSLWEFTVQRIAELPGLVYVELEERSRNGPASRAEVANSLSVYEFNPEGKVHRLRLAVADLSLQPWPACSSSSGVMTRG